MSTSQTVAPSMALGEILGTAREDATEQAAGWERASRPRVFEFPTDHGPHLGFRSEWWYFTGNLVTDDDEEFAFHFTLFRNAIVPQERVERVDPGQEEVNTSWRASQLYMGHLAVMNLTRGSGASYERFGRGALGLAGSQANPTRVWLEDWSVEELASESSLEPSFRVSAAQGGLMIELELSAIKPLVLQGDRGLSQKGSEVGNASYYYSVPRMTAEGSVSADGRSHEVSGTAWMDREWSTSSLDADQVGWDWFSLQLDSGEELMLYQLRRRDRSVHPLSSGKWVLASGETIALAQSDFEIEVLEDWKSEKSGVTYPSRWEVSVPSLELVLEVRPRMADQELVHSVVYWEGAVRAVGVRGSRVVEGLGFAELTGYAEPNG